MKDRLNELALEYAQRYQNLPIGAEKVSAPFYSNDIGLLYGNVMLEAGIDISEIDAVFKRFNNNAVPYGWYRGKATPDQLVEATYGIAQEWDLDICNAPRDIVTEFMKSAGLGIDCSGFVFNTLSYAYDALGMKDKFLDSLSWIGGERNAFKAGVFSFAGKSKVVNHKEAEPLDVIVLRSVRTDRFAHVALILEKGGVLTVAQSTIGRIPTGVCLTGANLSGELPDFGYKPNLSKETWEEQYAIGKLEIRRLNI
jgi:hypothetical protein